MLEPGRDLLKHLREVRVIPKARRGEVVRLVDDEEIPAEASVAAGLRCAAELLEHIRLLQVVVARDDAFVDTPRIRVETEFPL